MKVILGGHWEPAPAGWIVLTEREQDITHRLRWNDGMLDIIFTEHVIEHIPFHAAIGFMREALRTLKSGGIFRVVAPMIERICNFEGGEFGRRYAVESLTPYFQSELAALKPLHLDLTFDPHPFLVDSLTKKHGHQFCWSAKLMAEVLLRVGFSQSNVSSPGVSVYDPSSCVERTIRGTHGENLIREFGQVVYDPESGVVEAKK